MARNIPRSQVLSTFTDKLDIIGDIHGCVHTLTDLLEKLGYEYTGETWKHPDRLAVFVGDYIDRGLYSRQVLTLIKSMVDQGSAIALMGNHEFNFIAINTYDENGQPYRSHNKLKQHRATLKSIPPQEIQFWVDWFKTLPLFIETEKLRIVHAAWHEKHIDFISNQLPSNTVQDNLVQALKKGTPLNDAIIYILKGPELKQTEILPDNHPARNHSGVRFKWWEIFGPKPLLSDILVEPAPDLPVPEEFFRIYEPYPETAKPVIFGHYTIPGKPHILRKNATCIDFSVYKKLYLTAYRYNGEQEFCDQNLVYVKFNDKDVII